MLPRKTHLAMANALRCVQKEVSQGPWDEKSNYVCMVIDNLALCNIIREDIGQHLVNWIDKQLNPNGGIDTFKTWGHKQGIDMDNYQVYRHAWIDHMIKVLES